MFKTNLIKDSYDIRNAKLYGTSIKGHDKKVVKVINTVWDWLVKNTFIWNIHICIKEQLKFGDTCKSIQTRTERTFSWN